MNIEEILNTKLPIHPAMQGLFVEWREYEKRTGISVFCQVEEEYNLLFHIALLAQVDNILELGPGAGASTATMLRALKEKNKGYLTTVDILPEEALKVVNDRNRFARFGGNTNQFFANNIQTFDMVFIDADHTDRQSEIDIENALKYLNSGGIVVCHDILHFDDNQQVQYTDIHRHCSRQCGAHNKKLKYIEDIGHGMGIIY